LSAQIKQARSKFLDHPTRSTLVCVTLVFSLGLFQRAPRMLVALVDYAAHWLEFEMRSEQTEGMVETCGALSASKVAPDHQPSSNKCLRTTEATE
jgi:hypothetical protein